MNTHFALVPLTVALVLVACGGESAEPAKSAKPTKNPSSEVKAETPAAKKIAIPRSEFAIPTSPTEGRDPFFPDSMRLFASLPKHGVDKNGGKQSSTVLLSLKAISASGNRRVASINNRPFETGEEGELSFGSTRVRIRCVEIREDSVIIELDGQTQELRLRPGF